MKNQYNKTITACFVAYIVQAIVNNFVPLLFLTFQRTYEIPLAQITMLVTFNFGVQLLVDLLAVGFVDKIGYKKAIGGGLLEVIVSPVVEACPSDNKEKAMSMLHSFYCWGHVGVVLLSTVFFFVFGIENWKIMAVMWALIPLANAFVFVKVPVPSLMEEGEQGLSLKELFGMKMFWLLLIMMVCAGASEQAVSQWASTFAEKGLGISKIAGDLAGPMAFAVFMGTSRAFYGKYGDRMKLDRFMIISSLLCIASYLGISLAPVPILSLISCAICGLSVGIMWPGTFSKAAKALPRGGTAMFALLALGGDLGCSGGPTLVGTISSLAGENLKLGIFAAGIFPVLLLLGIGMCNNVKKERKGLAWNF